VLIPLAAAQEDGGAVMGTRQHQRPGARHQSSCGTATQSVAEQDSVGIGILCLDLIDPLLDAISQRDRLHVQRC